MNPITPIAILYACLGLFLFALGVRSYSRYKKLKSPTSLYLAYFGMLCSVFFLLNSVPMVLTNNTTILKASIIIGNIFYYMGMIVAVILIWHIALKRRVPLIVLLLPASILIGITFYGWTLSVITSQTAKVENGTFIYDLVNYPLWLDAFLSLIYITVGLSLFAEMKKNTEPGSKLRIGSFAFIFIGAGVIAIYNDLFLHSFNNSWLIYVFYAIILLLFTMFFFFKRSKN